MRTYTIDIPKTFAIDHSERDLPTGREVKELARTIRYECTAPELREWLSDANYYFDCAGFGWDMGDDAIGLQASARGTAQRIHRLMEAHGIPKSGPLAEALE
tara:strand:+ start:1268 stop:1573 length:306 start_codon:yes stop_codon:yes gene_type:complete